MQESAPSGATRRVPASELAAFLSQPAQVQHLKNLGVEMLVPKVFSQLCPVEAFLSQPRHSTSRIWGWRCSCLRYFLNYAIVPIAAQAQHLKNLGVEMLLPKVFSQLCPVEVFLNQPACPPRPSTSRIWVWRCLCLRYFLNYALSQPAQAQHLKNPGVEMLEPSSFLVYALNIFCNLI